jgi:hypothetical protein
MIALLAALAVVAVFLVGVSVGTYHTSRAIAEVTAERLRELGIPVGRWIAAGKRGRPL